MMLFYADNLYICSVRDDGVMWVSLDGEKMECAHDWEDFDLFTDRVLAEYDNVDPEVAKMYKDIAMVSSVSAPVQIGETLIRQ